MTVISTKSITGVTSITSPQSDDAVTLHTNDTTQRVSVTTGGMNVTGVVTATSFSGNITGTASGNPTLANGSNNRVITATGANALTGESTLTYDGTTLMNTGGTITAERGAIPSIEAKNSTDTSYARFYCSQTSGSGGYAAFQKLGTNSSAIGGANATQIWCTGDAPLVVGVNNGERLRITGVGSFGINNSDPKYTMHFKNAMSSSPSWIHMEVTGSNTEGGGGGIAFDTSASNSASNNSLFLATVSGERSGSGNGSNSLVFKTSKSGVPGDDGSTNSTPRTAMVINEDRNVGIGTTNADSLSGFTHSTGSTLVLNNLGSNSNWNGQIRLGNTGSGYLIDHNASSTTTTTFRNIYGASNAAALTKLESGLITFGTGTSYTERLRIQSTGQLLYSAASGDNTITSKRTNTAGSNGNYFFHLKATDENDNVVGGIGFHRDTAADDSRLVFQTRTSGGSNNERLRIGSDGRIIPAITGGTGGISLVGAFMARVTTIYDTNAGLLKINMATEEFDANGWYDTSNSRYTPLCKGWYQFNFYIQYKTNINGESVELFLYPYKNGSNTGLGGPVEGWNTNFGNYAFITYSTMIYLDGVDDYVEMWANCSRATDVAAACRMSGFLVHPVA